MKRLAIGCAIALLLLSACRRSNFRDSRGITLAIESEFSDLDPRTATDANSSRLCALIYSGLFYKDRSMDLQPDLVADYDVTDTCYTLRLKKGLRFHNGAPLTAEDVLFTYTSLLADDFVSYKKQNFALVKHITLLDSHTIRFELKQPFAPFLGYLTLGIVSKDVALKGTDSVQSRPVGSGPFRVARLEKGRFIRLERSSGYHGPAAHVPVLSVRVIKNTTTRLLELQNKGIDILQNDIPYDAVARFDQDPDFHVVHLPGINYQYIGCNMRDAILGRPEVRRAIAHAIRREAIITHVLQGYAQPARSLLHPINWAYCPDLPDYAFAPDTARRLIEAAGFTANGDGMYFSLEYKTSENSLAIANAQIIQEQLRQVGIDIKVIPREWATFYNDIRKGDFQLFSLRWVGISDPDIYYYIFHSSSIPPHGANRGHYKNSRLDGLLQEARRTLDRDRRKALYRQAQQIIGRELPYISLWYHDNIVIAQAHIQGARPYPDGSFRFLLDIRDSRP